MLERKGIEHEVVDLLPGFHPLQLRAAGFRGGTVPALWIQGRRVQGSRRISRTLEELPLRMRTLADPRPAIDEPRAELSELRHTRAARTARAP